MTRAVVPRCGDRSIQSRVSTTLFAVTLRVVISSPSTFTFTFTFTFTGISEQVGIHQSKPVKIMPDLTHDAIDMLPSALVVHIGRVPYIMAEWPEGNWVLPMEAAMAANTPRIPFTVRIVLSLGILLPVAAFP